MKQREAHLSESIALLEYQVQSSKSQLSDLLLKMEVKGNDTAGLVDEQQKVIDSLQKSHQGELESLRRMHAEEKLSVSTELAELKQRADEDSLSAKLQIVELSKTIDELNEQIKHIEA